MFSQNKRKLKFFLNIWSFSFLLKALFLSFSPHFLCSIPVTFFKVSLTFSLLSFLRVSFFFFFFLCHTYTHLPTYISSCSFMLIINSDKFEFFEHLLISHSLLSIRTQFFFFFVCLFVCLFVCFVLFCFVLLVYFVFVFVVLLFLCLFS